MKRLSQETGAIVSKSADKTLTAIDQANLQKRYRAIPTHGEKELSAIPPKPSGKLACIRCP